MRKVFVAVEGQRHQTEVVAMSADQAEDFLLEHPFKQMDAENGDSWVELHVPEQAKAILAAVECVSNATWEGPGWYRAYETNKSVELQKDDELFERLQRRFKSVSEDFNLLHRLMRDS